MTKKEEEENLDWYTQSNIPKVPVDKVLTYAEAMDLVDLNNHQVEFCDTCDATTVICGQCGMNMCSCGHGCDMCKEADRISTAVHKHEQEEYEKWLEAKWLEARRNNDR